MDSSASSTQTAPNQKTTDQPMNRTQPPATTAPSDDTNNAPVQQKQPTTAQSMGSANKEAGPAVMVAESSDENDEEEDKIQVAPQETKTQVVQQPGAGVTDEAELSEQVSESAGTGVEVEPFVEKTPDQEKPELSKEVQQAGVTHSGPGVIPDTIQVKENAFGVKSLPEPYPEAKRLEKHTPFKSSKHWLMATVMYVWRKLNPKIEEKGGAEVKTEK